MKRKLSVGVRASRPQMKRKFTVLLCLLTLLLPTLAKAQQQVGKMIKACDELTTSQNQCTDSDLGKFLSRQDIIWTMLPDHYEKSAFMGNGLIGSMVYKRSDHEIAFAIGHEDVTEHRRDNFRLPIGRLLLKTKGKILNGTARLDLWNAETRFEVETNAGLIRFRALNHANEMALMIDIERLQGEKEATFAWESDEAVVYREKIQNQLPKELNPPVELKTDGDISYSIQNRLGGGQYSVAWTERHNPQQADMPLSQVILSVADSYPEQTANETARQTVKNIASQDWSKLIDEHRAWWHNYYLSSFVSVPDSQMESFYWIQLYKLASATRSDRHVIDLMGPWYSPTVWPRIWCDLNVQICYLPVYASNHCELGESLTNLIDKKRDNLVANAKVVWGIDNGATIATTADNDLKCFESIQKSEGAGWYLNPGDFVWLLQDYWLQYRYTMDNSYIADRNKHALFDMLKGAFNVYRQILKEGDDGKFHLPVMCSPEYPTRAADTTYSLALVRWLCDRLIEINDKCKFNDPQAEEWKKVRDSLPDYYVNENGFMVGKDVPFARSHRHWSHMLMIWPLCSYTVDDPQRRALVEKTLDYWTTVDGGRELFGWSQAAAASMYALLGNGNKAREFLLRHHNNKLFVRCNTQYYEGWPVIECSHIAARALQEMLIQSWGNQIRVFPAIPTDWKETSFANMRTEGAFLVSAIRKDGKTSWVKVESLAGEECRLVPNFIGEFKSSNPEKVQDLGNSMYKIALNKGESITLWQGKENQKVAPVTMPDGQVPNFWGLKAPTIDFKKALSVGKPVKASSNWDATGYDVTKAFDGNINTRWGAEPNSRSGWIEVDLTQSTEIHKFAISEANFARVQEFVIEVRDNESDEWTTVHKGTTINSNSFIVPLDKPVTARYVRLNVLKANDVPTLEEFGVY